MEQQVRLGDRPYVVPLAMVGADDGGELHEVRASEGVTEKALQQDAEVLALHDPEQLTPVGGVAALLRC